MRKVRAYRDFLLREFREPPPSWLWRMRALMSGHPSPGLSMLPDTAFRDGDYIAYFRQRQRELRGPQAQLLRVLSDKISQKLWLDRVMPDVAPPMLYYIAGKRLIGLDPGAVPLLTADLPTLAREAGGLFLKPADADRGAGALRLEVIDDGVQLNRKPVGERWAAGLERRRFSGYTVSRLIEPDAWSAAFFPGVLNTLRVLTGTHAGSRRSIVLAATMKMARASTYPTDNWKLGRGGLSALVDPGTGRLAAALSYDQAARRRVYVDNHPESGATILGSEVPGWRDLALTMTELASILPYPGIVGWDVALTPRGPVVVEANVSPGLNIHQCHASLKATPEQRVYWAEVRL